MNDLKNSTLTEKILLGIIAAGLATIGFYVGYVYLSNGVNSVTIGIIVGFIIMVGGISFSFILDELLKKFFPNFHPNGIAKDETIEDSATSEDTVASTDEEETFFNTDDAVEAPAARGDARKTKIKRVSPFANKKVEKVTTSPNEDIHKVEEDAQKDKSDANIVDPVFASNKGTEDKEGPSATEETPALILIDELGNLKQDDTDAMDVEKLKARGEARRIVSDIARVGRENAVNILIANGPVSENADEENTSEDESKEESSEELSLVDFIASHPMYPPRKMAREYIAAGGKESTENILALMS